MNHLEIAKTAKKDFIAALSLWLGLEIVSFIIFPFLKMIQPGERLQIWFMISLPSGLLGSLLIAGSSQFIADTSDRDSPEKRFLRVWAGQAVGWVGLVGVTFPLLMVGVEFLAEAYKKITTFQ
jgi:hypothetical protein